MTHAMQLRQAVRADVPDIQRVRHSVLENRLTSRVIPDDEVIESIERIGRGWVIEQDARIVGFAIGNAQTGNVWALFVEPQWEGLGGGRLLHDTMLEWLASVGVRRAWLTTGPGTRAERFYERSGWQNCGLQADGELRFERELNQTRDNESV